MSIFSKLKDPFRSAIDSAKLPNDFDLTEHGLMERKAWPSTINDPYRPKLPEGWIYTDNSQDTHGLFHCKNKKCEMRVERLRYIFAPIPDTFPCPICHQKMIHEGLYSAYFTTLPKLHDAGAGVPEGLRIAERSWDRFYKVYLASVEIGDKKIHEFEIPALDYILDVLSKIPEAELEDTIYTDLNRVSLIHYPEVREKGKYIRKLQNVSTSFISECITEDPQKQVDLAKDFSSRIEPILESMGQEPEARKAIYVDAKWYFYVWRQFKIIKCEKVGRYNMIWK